MGRPGWSCLLARVVSDIPVASSFCRHRRTVRIAAMHLINTCIRSSFLAKVSRFVCPLICINLPGSNSDTWLQLLSWKNTRRLLLFYVVFFPSTTFISFFLFNLPYCSPSSASPSCLNTSIKTCKEQHITEKWITLHIKSPWSSPCCPVVVLRWVVYI